MNKKVSKVSNAMKIFDSYIEHLINIGYDIDSDSSSISKIIKCYEGKKEELKDLKEKYNTLVNCILEDAFDDMNGNVEITLRCLKRQGIIELKDGQYIRPNLPYEENGAYIIGHNHKRDKDYFIKDNELDEYTKALERELKEYHEAQEIFKKYNIRDETMYECIKRMSKKIDELEEEKENEEK